MRRRIAIAMVVALALAACESSEPESVSPDRTAQAEPDGKKQREPKSDSTKSAKDKDPGDRQTRERDKPKPKPKPKPEEQSEPPEPTPTTDPPPERRRPARYLVTEVVDGDTVKVAKGGETTIRLIGIDTPETVHPFEPVECGGPQASKTAAALLTGERVQLVYDASQGRLDAYDRTLAYVTVPGLGDFGLAMLRRGHAAEYTYDTAYAKQSQYLQAESRAQGLDKGVWDRCGGVDAPLEQPTPDPEPTPTPEPPPTEEPEDPAPNSGCAVDYSPCVPPYPPDLDCGDVEGPITVTGDDPHGFDAEGDGTGCESTPAPEPPPTEEPEDPAPNSGCAAGYSPCVPPYPPDLDCGDVEGPITVTGDDPHSFDAEGDGTGCES